MEGDQIRTLFSRNHDTIFPKLAVFIDGLTGRWECGFFLQKKSILFIIIIFLSAQSVFSQKLVDGTGSDLDSDRIFDWITKDLNDYEGVYKFGDSEWESSFFVFIDDGFICAQLRYSEWGLNRNGKVIGTNSFYITVNNIQIIKNRMLINGWKARFVYLEDYNRDKSAGLILDNSISDAGWEIKNEFGLRLNSKLRVYYPGKYPEASFRLLIEKELQRTSKNNLKIMRNEIFARYGYVFKRDGKMDKYFKSRSWYKPEKNCVNDYLTEIERKNIGLIRKMEANK